MKTCIGKFRNLSGTDITALSLITAAFIYLFVISFFNGTVSDEAFYISIPIRLMNGDGLLTDEWHLSQLSSVLLYPPVRLYILFTGSTEGIILFMRQLFCLMQLLTGLLIYKTFRKEGIAAILASLLFMLYCVINLMTLSYNTMGEALLFFLICTVFSIFDKPAYPKAFIAGILLGAFILCQPLGIVFCIIYSAAVITAGILHKKDGRPVLFLLTEKAFLSVFAGAFAVFLYFLFFLLKNSELSTVFSCFPGIFNDAEHMKITNELGISTFSPVLFFSDMAMATGVVPLITAAVIFISGLFIKKKSKALAVIICSTALILLNVSFYVKIISDKINGGTADINFFFLPLALSGLPFYLLSNKKNHRVFILIWCTGIMYALFMTISSNLHLHTSVNGYVISSAASVILARELLSELKEKKEPVFRNACIVLCLAVFGFASFQTGTMAVYTSATRGSLLSARLTEGIYSGITLPSSQAIVYASVYKDAQKIKELTDGTERLFVVENIPAMYLESGLKTGAHSGWFFAEQLAYPEVRNRFRNYYEITPENIPQYIYVPAFINTPEGIISVPPKRTAELAFALFDGEAQNLESGLLIEVTGLKDE